MYSYYSLNREVCKFANVLKSLGVKKGHIVSIHLPRIPEQVIAMLACAKIGAGHSVVYGGFSVEALAERIEDAQSKVLVTADGGWIRGKVVHLKDITDEAVARQPRIETCIVVRRTGKEINMEAGRDYWYNDLMSLPIASPVCQTEPMDAAATAWALRKWRAPWSAIPRYRRPQPSACPMT
jgi:acetyl-CoA synthetase